MHLPPGKDKAGKIFSLLEISIKLLFAGFVNLFNYAKVKETSLKGHSDSVDQVDWSPTHVNHLVSASGDRTVRVWDMRCK